MTKADSHFPDRKKMIYCPFCDTWSRQDSMVARKRLGIHITEKHSEEVLFHKDETPPELEDIDS